MLVKRGSPKKRWQKSWSEGGSGGGGWGEDLAVVLVPLVLRVSFLLPIFYDSGSDCYCRIVVDDVRRCSGVFLWWQTV